MAIFKKKKKGENISESLEAEDSLPPLEEKYKQKKGQVKKGKTKAAPTAKPIPVNISIEIEKLKTQLEALSQTRIIFSERFSSISEQIGELRNMVVSQEQEFSELEVKSAKTNEVMAQLEPEKIMTEISKIDMRIEAIKGKMESNEAVNSMIMKELKDQRSRMALFKGVEDTIKLTQEVREDLTNIKKVEAAIELHSNKVEAMFIQMQERFSEFEKFKEMAEDTNSAFKEQIKEFDTIKVRFADLVKTEDIKVVKEALSGVMDDFSTRLLDIEKISGSMKEHQKSLQAIREVKEQLGKAAETRIPEIDKLQNMFAAAEDVKAFEQELKKLKTLMGYGFKRVQQMESRMFVEKETYEVIRQLILKYLDKGYTKRQIVDAFEMQGWPKQLIKQYID